MNYKERRITEHGEIVNEKVVKYYSPFKPGKGYNFKYKSTKIKSYLDIPLPDEFTDSEIGKLTRLSRCMYSSSNLFAKRSTGNRIVPVSKNDIRKIVGLSQNRFYEFYNKAVTHKILKSIVLDGDTYYCLNPIYFNSTEYIPLYLFIAFQSELSEHLPKWVILKYLDEKSCTG